MGAEELRAFSCTFDICSLGARLIELHEVREQSSAIVTRLIACTHVHTPRLAQTAGRLFLPTARFLSRSFLNLSPHFCLLHL